MKRFWDKVEKDGDCLIWKAASRGLGYGCIKHKGKVYDSHRFVFYLLYGEHPSTCVLHLCKNRSCVNPQHLYLGTFKDNTKDSIDEGTHYVPMGEENGNSKLNYKKAEKIREEYKNGGESHRSLGKKYGVNYSTIYSILKNKTWRISEMVSRRSFTAR